MQDAAMKRIFLDRLRDPVHGGNRLDRILPGS
jgi:hypothetical protein